MTIDGLKRPFMLSFHYGQRMFRIAPKILFSVISATHTFISVFTEHFWLASPSVWYSFEIEGYCKE